MCPFFRARSSQTVKRHIIIERPFRTELKHLFLMFRSADLMCAILSPAYDLLIVCVISQSE